MSLKTFGLKFKFRQWSYRGILTLTELFLLGLMVLPAYAFRNTGDKASLLDVGVRQQTNLMTRVLSAGQLSAAETGSKLGVKVVWHSQLSTPSSPVAQI